MAIDRPCRAMLRPVCESLEIRLLMFGQLRLAKGLSVLGANGSSYEDVAAAVRDAGGFQIDLLINNQKGEVVLHPPAIQVDATNFMFSTLQLASAESNGQAELVYSYQTNPAAATTGITTVSAAVNTVGGVYFIEGDPDRPFAVDVTPGPTFATSAVYPSGFRLNRKSARTSILLGPLTGRTGAEDIVVASGSELAVLYATTTTTGQPALSPPVYMPNPFDTVSPTGVTTIGQIIALTDLNGDGIPDLLGIESTGHREIVCDAIGQDTTTGGSTGTASTAWSLLTAAPITTTGPAPVQPIDLALLGDLNGDGIPDLVLISGDNLQVADDTTPQGSTTVQFSFQKIEDGIVQVPANSLLIGKMDGSNDAEVFYLTTTLGDGAGRINRVR